ncbi:hypothetical protein B0J13DRAFT_661683 [Dactylonectria estremocensis]|uniref:Uncharacterized protein n=1 Tax=Dactylonectria estremocensis TaxID=1079267 RepID=A0A9P9I7J6_9HYPO|nr:hypothetical protein B0J13DRAFT_661683 [Dactylonectria estremocensis]
MPSQDAYCTACFHRLQPDMPQWRFASSKLQSLTPLRRLSQGPALQTCLEMSVFESTRRRVQESYHGIEGYRLQANHHLDKELDPELNARGRMSLSESMGEMKPTASGGGDGGGGGSEGGREGDVGRGEVFVVEGVKVVVGGVMAVEEGVMDVTEGVVKGVIAMVEGAMVEEGVMMLEGVTVVVAAVVDAAALACFVVSVPSEDAKTLYCQG